MADQLTGQDLDEAVAIEMGWTVVVPADRSHVAWQHRKDLGTWEKLRSYSNNPATSHEMLTHLHQFGVVEMHSGPRGASVKLCVEGRVASRTMIGATLNEALARLVVEVARARREKEALRA